LLPGGARLLPQQSNAGHHQTERKQADKGQTMNFNSHQPTPSPPDDIHFTFTHTSLHTTVPQVGKTEVPDSLTPLTNQQRLQILESTEVLPVALTIH